MKKVTTILRNVHDFIFPSYRHKLAHVVAGCSSLLDVGCGKDSPVKFFAHTMHTVGVDIFAPAIEQSKGSQIHNEYHQMNVLDIGRKFEEKTFDCVLASDLIEHLEKEDGLRLLDMMEKIARKKVIVFTPRGFLEQHEYEDNPWQKHKSGWEVDEMQARGYNVVGINGCRWVWDMHYLWKDRGRAPILIRTFRKILVDVTQLFAWFFPGCAFQILCVKDVGK